MLSLYLHKYQDKGMSFVIMITVFPGVIFCLITFYTVIVFRCNRHVFGNTKLANYIRKCARCISTITACLELTYT